MKRLIAPLAFSMIVLFCAVVSADEDHEKEKKAETLTLTGEIVDTGCYLGHGAKGADHKSCALRCIAGGMAMALLTEDDTLYLLTMSHEDADPYNEAKELAALAVEITGPVHERNGMKSIEVTAVKKVETPASKK